MILPHPESDLSVNILVLGTDIIKCLKNRGFVLIEDVLITFLSKENKRTPDMFLNTLAFLFAVGVIEKKEYKIKLTPRIPKQIELF